MLALVTTVLIVLTILLINEWWWRGKNHGEVSRKFVHITVGTFVAFWPFFLTWDQIRLLSAAFVIVVLLSQRLDLFRAIHSVQRPTYGEVLFAVAVGLLTFVTQDPVVYAVALLHMGIADGLAAIMGVTFGRTTTYTVFGHKKSLIGTAIFFVCSLSILFAFTVYRDIAFAWTYVWLAVTLSVAENIAVKGIDNLLVPVAVGLLLTQVA